MPKVKYPEEWGLTALEQSYLTALKGGRMQTPDGLIRLHESVPETDLKIKQNVARVISSLRKKLDPLNIELETHWGEGWKIGRVFRARLTELLNKAKTGA